jgi:hypothetical protein
VILSAVSRFPAQAPNLAYVCPVPSRAANQEQTEILRSTPVNRRELVHGLGVVGLRAIAPRLELGWPTPGRERGSRTAADAAPLYSGRD